MSAGTLRLGGTAPVPRIGLGTMRLPAVGGPGARADAVALVRRALELGVRLIDTAPVYGGGLAEEAVGEALRGGPADVVVATKGGAAPVGGGAWTMDGRPAALRASCEASLRRLRREAIDLYVLHRPDPSVPLEESVGALDDLRRAGLVRHVGVGCVTAGELERALSVAPVAAVQNRMSVAGPHDDAVLAVCERAGIAAIPWYPLGCGVLTRRDGPLAPAAARAGATPAQVAIAWLLARSPVVIAAPGTGDAAHLAENVAAAAVDLGPAADQLPRSSSPGSSTST